MAGRKLEFDREEALEKAMELFWSKGYAATGLCDLIDHMGIQRQSLYNTFGNKQKLFQEAVRHYGQCVLSRVEAQLNDPGSPLGNIRNFFRAAAEQAVNPNYRGCMVTNTMMELASCDPAIAGEVRLLTRRIEKAFEQTLDRAVAAKELRPDTNTREVARFLHHILLGFNVCGKTHPSRSYVDDILNVTLSILK